MPAAWAHGPTRQKVVEKIEIAAPPAKVWALVGDYARWQAWHPAIAETRAEQGNAVGSLRRLGIHGGKYLEEILEARDEAGMMLKYRITAGDALPVTNYSSSISVAAQGAGSIVEWRGAFYRGYPNNNPPPEQNDEAAVRAVTGVYQLGLQNLKKILEAKP